MKAKQGVVAGLATLASVLSASIPVASANGGQMSGSGLVREVRRGTADFRNVSNALASGYVSSGSCVSGPEEGAMGVHFPNPDLVGDGALDPRRPDILIYEPRNGRLRLVGVEFIVIAEDWNAAHPGPPVLLGQHFHYAGSPNRYGLPPFYALHVWAWRQNRLGMFADWNPAVSCEEYEGDP